MKALERRPRPLPPVPKKLDVEKEARLVQVACSVPPEGRVRWTVKMLAEELVLKVYRRPYDPRHPVVCMDEMSKQLVV